MIHLENEKSYADIDPLNGARVVQFGIFSNQDKKSKEHRLLWDKMQKEDSGWCHGGIPILFPFAGRVWSSNKQGYYFLNGTEFPMPIHGFVHHKPWEIVEQKSSSIEMVFSSSNETRKLYPWEFELRVHWKLKETSLLYYFSIKNKGCLYPSWIKKEMPFAMGLHPYFQVNSLKEKDLQLLCQPGKQYAVTKEGRVGSLGKWDPSCSVSKKPSLILQDFHEPYVDMKLNHHPNIRVRIEMENCEQTIILWSGAKDYLCVEPWMGLPDALQNPKGLVWVKENEQQTWSGSFCGEVKF
ncbi:MAG: hypothetical protein AB8C84_12545 [Oligoflexales bacterium]